jgi:hypothetical protein
MAEKLKRMKNGDDSADSGGSPPDGFWVTAKSWWDGATRDSGSVKRNLAMLFGVTLAAMLCIWSVGGAIALIIGSVHVWSLAGTGVGAASVLMTAGIRLRRKRPKP